MKKVRVISSPQLQHHRVEMAGEKDDVSECTVCGPNSIFLSFEERRKELSQISRRLNSVLSLLSLIGKEKKQLEKDINSRILSPLPPRQHQVEESESTTQDLCAAKHALLAAKNNLNELRALRGEKEQLYSSKVVINNNLKKNLKDLSKKLYIERMRYALRAYEMMNIGVFVSKEHRNTKSSEVLHITGKAENQKSEIRNQTSDIRKYPEQVAAQFSEFLFRTMETMTVFSTFWR